MIRNILGEIFDISPTGNKIEVSQAGIARHENGKMVEEREDFDLLGIYRQHGWEVKPKEEK